MYAARCEVCFEIGSSSSLLSSVPHEIVLNVATSGWLHDLPELSLLDTRLIPLPVACSRSQAPSMVRCRTFDVSLSTRYEKVAVIVNISKMAGHAAQQRVLLGCLETGQVLNTMSTQSPITTSMQQFGLQLHQTPAPQEIARLVSLPNKPTRPATSSPTATTLTPLCAAASSNGALPTLSCLSEHYLHYIVTWRKRHEHCRQRMGRILSCYADGGRALELQNMCFLRILTFTEK